jgi:uncharacterized protein YfaS (alpha-2-macroglobulin family)
MLSFGILTAMLSLSGALRTSPPVVELFHPEASLAFVEPGGQLFPAHASAVRLQMVSVDTVEVRVFARSLGLALPGNDPLEEFIDERRDTVPSRPLWSRRHVRPRDSLAHWSVTLDLAAISRAGNGQFLDVRAFAAPKAIRPAANQFECDTLRTRKGFLVSRMGLFATRVGAGPARVTALNLATGKAWPGAKVVIHDANGAILRTGTTDFKGEVRLVLSDGAVAVGKAGTEQGRMRLDGEEARESQELGETWGDGASQEDSKGRSRLFAYLMQGTWQPGDSMVVGAVVWPDPGTPREPLRVRVVDAGRVVLDSQRLEIPSDGHVQARMHLSTSAYTGPAQIELEHGAVHRTMNVKIEVARAHRLQSQLETRLDTSGTDPKVIVRLTGAWLSGKAGSGLQARIGGRWLPELSQEQCGSRMDVRRDPGLAGVKFPEREIVLDEAGAWEDTLVIPQAMALHAQGGLSLDALVFEGGGVGVKATAVARWNWGAVPDLRLRLERHRVTVKAGLQSSRCQRISGKPLRLVIDAPWLFPHVLDTTVTSGDSLVWSLARLPRNVSDGRPEQPVLEFRLCQDSLRCVTTRAKLRWPEPDRNEPVEFVGDEAKAGPQDERKDADLDTLRPGDPVKLAWLSKQSGLALIQVIQGSRELHREWMPVHRGWMKWRRQVEPLWDPGVTVFVSEIRARGKGDTAELLRQSNATFTVRRPDRILELAVEPVDSLRPLQTNRIRIVNRSKAPGSVVLSVIDQGILDIDRFQTADPAGFLDEVEDLEATWWKGLGRFAWNWWCQESRLECQERSGYGMVGEAGLGSVGRMGLGAGGAGRSILSRSRSPQQDTLRMRKQGMPVSWISSVMALPAQGLWVEVPLPAYTGQVRLTAMGVSGHRLGMAQRQATVQSPLEMKATLPRQMQPGDTARVEIRLLGAKPAARLQLKTAGQLTLLSSPDCPLASVLGNGICQAVVVAGEQVGTGFLEAIATDGNDRMTLPLMVDVQAQRLFGKERQRKSSASGEFTFELDRRFQDSGTTVNLELSTRGMLGTAPRMQELLQYPHGCLEQTVSKAYPQLFLEELTPGMNAVDRAKARSHVQAAIAKLGSFKTSDGLLSLWPGGKSSYPTGSLHAAHFLLDASLRGHEVPRDLKDGLFGSIRTSREFRSVAEKLEQQSFLARRGQVDLDALRKLEESMSGSVQRWIFAQSWKVGTQNFNGRNPQMEKADTIAKIHAKLAGNAMTTTRELDGGLRSPTGDRARTLEAMLDLDWKPGRDSIVTSLVDVLSSSSYLSTYETALSLRALSRWNRQNRSRDTGVSMRVDSWPWQPLTMVGGQASVELPGSSHRVQVRGPSVAGQKLEGLLTRSGILRTDEPIRDSGLALEIRWLQKGREDSSLPFVPLRGDFVARVSVRNLQPHAIPNAAFTLWLPGGWEARNPRLDSTLAKTSPLLAVDIRTDRVVQHFDLKPGETRMLEIPLRATIAGDWQGPEAWVEALYDGALQVRRTYGRVKVGVDP